MEEKARKILVVDDVAENRKILATILKKNTDYEVMLAADGNSVLSSIESDIPDLILLDIMMPEMDGYEVARILRSRERTRDIPIIFITAVIDVESIVKAFESGGMDYITKPFNRSELLSRVDSHMKLKIIQDELKYKNLLLEDRELHLVNLVDEKTKKLEKITSALVSALESANFYNDSDTGNHIKRVSSYSVLLAEHYGCDRDFVKRIQLFASLHDIGKVGISESLLKKPGKYTTEEFVLMQKHVIIGARMLDNPEIDVMAKNVALYHHEKWEGSGYTNKMRGEDIPLEGRIVALADVFDALANRRVYKEAYDGIRIDRIIAESAGKHFDPKLVDIYFTFKDEFLRIRDNFKD